MKSFKPSITAKFVATAKALEMIIPCEKKILYDQYSQYFASSPVVFLSSLPFVSKLIPILLKNRIGGLYYCVARAKFIDDYLRGCLERGVQQVVILGAGYDTTSLRYSTSSFSLKIYELDHPATQQEKIRIIKHYGLRCHPSTYFIAHDLTKDNLYDSLSSHGFNFEQQTLFILSGVCMYLSKAENEKIFEFIASSILSLTFVVFDFILPVSRNSKEFSRAWSTSKRVKKHYEPFRWIPVWEEVEEMLKKYSFGHIDVINHKKLLNQYYADTEKMVPVDSFYRIVTAWK